MHAAFAWGTCLNAKCKCLSKAQKCKTLHNGLTTMYHTVLISTSFVFIG